jgi:hypothetical protein
MCERLYHRVFGTWSYGFRHWWYQCDAIGGVNQRFPNRGFVSFCFVRASEAECARETVLSLSLLDGKASQLPPATVGCNSNGLAQGGPQMDHLEHWGPMGLPKGALPHGSPPREVPYETPCAIGAHGRIWGHPAGAPWVPSRRVPYGIWCPIWPRDRPKLGPPMGP